MNTRRVGKTAALSIVTHVVLVGMKYGLATLTGSVALLADAAHSLSDILVSGLVLIGAWITRKGWRMAAIIENVIALLIALFIMSAAVALVVTRFSPAPQGASSLLPIALIGAVICAAISRLVGQYQLKVGRAEQSVSLIADGHHTIMDVYTTGVVIASLLGQTLGLNLDSLAAVVVAVFVFEVGVEVAVLAIKGLVRQHAFVVRDATETAFALLKKGFNPIRRLLERLTGRTMDGAATRLCEAFRTHRRRIVLVTLGLLTALYAASGVYTVAPHQSALVTVFGKVGPAPCGPGIHYAPPRPIGRVYKVDTHLVRRKEVGFRTVPKEDDKALGTSRADYEWHSLHLSGLYKKMKNEAIMLTGDENMIDMNAVVQYTVADPRLFLFAVDEPEELVCVLTEIVLRSILSVTPIDRVLTESRNAIEQRAVQDLQQQVDRIGAGVRVVAVELQDVHPPVEVVRAFREVASAREDKAMTVNKAIASRNERIPGARAEAAAEQFGAQGYLTSKVLDAQGDAGRFVSRATEYARARKVTGYRMYLQAMENVLAGRRKFIVSPDLEPGALDLRIFARGSASPAQPTTKKPTTE